jgi:hypothetical protein
MRIEDLHIEQQMDTSKNIYNNHAQTIDGRLPRWEESDPKIYSTIKDLISEKK